MTEDPIDYRAEHQDVPLFSKLKREAVEIANSRHHILRRFGPTRSHNGGFAATAECKLCEGTVQVKTRPQPNEINLGGHCTGINCKQNTLIKPGKTDVTSQPTDKAITIKPRKAKLVLIQLWPKRNPNLHGMTISELRVHVRSCERMIRNMQQAMCTSINAIEKYAYDDASL